MSAACRVPERLHVRYVDGSGAVTDRRIEPYRVVNVERRWYLVAHDLDRRAWRTFRLDRMSDVRRTGHGVVFHDPPEPAQYVRESITTAPYRYRAVIVVQAPIEAVAERVPASVGVLEEIAEGVTRSRPAPTTWSTSWCTSARSATTSSSRNRRSCGPRCARSASACCAPAGGQR